MRLTNKINEKLSSIMFRTAVLTRDWTDPQSNIIFDIYFPEWRLSKVSISEKIITLATLFCSSPEILFPTFMMLILAKYREIPLDEKVKIIKI